jgi:hypothetical protein
MSRKPPPSDDRGNRPTEDRPPDDRDNRPTDDGPPDDGPPGGAALPSGRQPPLAVGIERVRRRGDVVELVVRLRSRHPDRVLHYIAEVRAIVFEAGRFVVRLTDQGREVIPGAVGRLPVFGRIDPGATALLTLRLPATIIRLLTPPAPGTEAVLAEYAVDPEADFEVVIGWSDTPYYPDPRDRHATAGRTGGWEQGLARATR